MDQKANTVADLAAVLSLQDEGPTAEQITHAERRLESIGKLKASGKKRMQKKDPQEPDKGGVDGVKVRWANLLDAEFAEKWPSQIVHNGLERQRYTAAFPQMDEKDGDVRGQEEEVELPVSLRGGLVR